MTRIQKLYLSNLLTGLVFWYGIEKLFMRSIGFDAVDIGIITAVAACFTLLFDVPAGLIADRWSRKGQLMVAAFCFMMSSLLYGVSEGLGLYLVGVFFFACYLVNTSGTYQAIIYDVLHEEGRTAQYGRIMGRAYALFLCGAGLGNIASGTIARLGLDWPFFLSMIPPVLNILLLASLQEPTFHKDMQKEKFLLQFRDDLKLIARNRLVRSLTVFSVVFSVIATFTLDFGQLYILKFTDDPVLLGWSWAVFAFALAIGSFVAHRAQRHLGLILPGAMVLFMSLSLSRRAWTLVPFMLYAVANTAAVMLIEAKVQESTPSAVRASILSFVSMLGRLFSLPTALFLGWLIRTHDVFWALRFLGAVAFVAALYWLITGTRRLKVSQVSAPADGWHLSE